MEQITMNRVDTAADDSFDVWIEVRYWGGASCSPWNLAVEGGNAF